MSGALTLFLFAAATAAAASVAEPTHSPVVGHSSTHKTGGSGGQASHKSSGVSHSGHKSSGGSHSSSHHHHTEHHSSVASRASHKSSGVSHSGHKSSGGSHSSSHHHHTEHHSSLASRAPTEPAHAAPDLQMHSQPLLPTSKGEWTPSSRRSGGAASSPVKRMGAPGKPVVGLFKNNFAIPNPAAANGVPSKPSGLFTEKMHNMDAGVPGTRTGIPGRKGLFNGKQPSDLEDPLGFSGEAQMQKKHGSHWFFDTATPSTHLRRAMTGVSGSAKALGSIGKKALVHLSSWPPQSPLATSKAAAQQKAPQKHPSQLQQHQKAPQQHSQMPQLHQKLPLQHQHQSHQHSSK